MRSIFISLYFIYILVGLMYSAIMFSISPMGIGWFSSIVAHGIPLFWFLFLYLGRLTNHSFASLLTTAGTGTAFLICLGNNRVNGSDDLSAILPAISLLGWLIYDRWYVIDVRPTQPITTSEAFPDITFKDAQGNDFKLSQSQNSKVVIFFSSTWSAFSKFQQKDFEQHILQFKEKGVDLYFISGEQVQSSASGIHFLTDQGQASAQLRLSNRQGMPIGLTLVGFHPPMHRPHLYLLDPNNQIISEHVTTDFRKLPNSEWALRFF
ncbi:MAG: redoxin domain-containing protein [Cryomorphaceae bacterium]|nr:redoxin domain-containing protein [Cryomorphaceae bacterium]